MLALDDEPDARKSSAPSHASGDPAFGHSNAGLSNVEGRNLALEGRIQAGDSGRGFEAQERRAEGARPPTLRHPSAAAAAHSG